MALSCEWPADSLSPSSPRFSLRLPQIRQFNSHLMVADRHDAFTIEISPNGFEYIERDENSAVNFSLDCFPIPSSLNAHTWLSFPAVPLEPLHQPYHAQEE